MVDLFDSAKTFMRKTGNPNQWGDDLNASALLEDILKDHFYLITDGKELLGAFVLLEEEEETYRTIAGKWRYDRKYFTLHRCVSSGKVPRLMDTIFRYAFSHIDYLRIDTHEDNTVMQNAILRNGFQEAGIITLKNGDPRIAYEGTRKQFRRNHDSF